MKDDAAAVAVVGGSYTVSAPRLFIPADTTRYFSSLGRLKRALDVLLAGLALAIVSPLFLAISLLIKRGSPGPVLFVQERLGRDGRPFKFYKFRSMLHNSDDAIHRQFAAMFIAGDEGGCAASNSGDKVFKLKRDDVKEEKHLPQSMMPAGLAAGLTVEEFTSLIEYLVTLKSIGG